MGVQAIKKMGGTVIAQDEARVGVLRHAERRHPDRARRFRAPLDEIAPALPIAGRSAARPHERRTETSPSFEALLELPASESRGFDFTGYKRSSLMRRIHKRMQPVGRRGRTPTTSTTSRSTRDEFTALFNTILINVTGFFRDPDGVGVPRDARSSRGSSRAKRRDAADPGLERGLRLGRGGLHARDAARRGARRRRVPRPGEDLRHRRRRGGAGPGAAGAATARARLSRRPARAASSATSSRSSGRYVFHKDLRRSVIFGRHDLVQDAPISRLDLLVCRNTLMYFNAETQARDPRAASTSRSADGRLPVPRQGGDAAHPRAALVHARRPQAAGLRQGARTRRRRPADARASCAADGAPSEPRRADMLRDVALRARPRRPRSSSTADGVLVAGQRAGARSCSACPQTDVGRPLQDLELSYRPAELRSPHRAGRRERAAPCGSPTCAAAAAGRPPYLDVQVSPADRPTGPSSLGVDDLASTTSPTTSRLAGRARTARNAGARDHQRGAPVDQRGARDHQRGAPVDRRGAGDDQRGAPVDQRGAGDDERGAPVHQRGARRRSTTSSASAATS